MRITIILSFLLFFISCQTEKKKIDVSDNAIEIASKTNIKYAKGFSVQEFEEYKILTLKNAWKEDEKTYRYVLYKNEKPKNVAGAAFIKIPITSIACMSLTHVAFLEELGLENSIVALSGCNYVSSTKIKNQIENNVIKEIGYQQNVNYEMLVDEAPNFIMAYGINTSSNGSINKMKDLGLEVVLNAEYMETHPLGKAEWIKFVAAFYGEDKKATEIFNEIEKEYLSLLELTKEIKEKPTVFTGMPWNGSWYVAGAKSFQVQLFKDAGATYLWLDNNEQSSIVKSKEIIINEAYDADFWLNQNSYNSIAAVLDFDEKFKGFNAVKELQLYNNDNRLNNENGNDYWESGVIKPQVVLKDLIKIFHPDLIQHELYYYRKLK